MHICMSMYMHICDTHTCVEVREFSVGTGSLLRERVLFRESGDSSVGGDSFLWEQVLFRRSGLSSVLRIELSSWGLVSKHLYLLRHLANLILNSMPCFQQPGICFHGHFLQWSQSQQEMAIRTSCFPLPSGSTASFLFQLRVTLCSMSLSQGPEDGSRLPRANLDFFTLDPKCPLDFMVSSGNLECIGNH